MVKGMKSLLRKSMMRFVACTALLFALAAPAFYYLTKNYYAEDLEDLIEAVREGQTLPTFDLAEDVMKGIMLQYLLITVLLGVGVTLTMRLVSKRLWKPFEQTLESIATFRIEKSRIPDLPRSDIKEFATLNEALRRLMVKSVNSYKAQKEFTENASHELQTPLAIFQAKLELLLQQPGLTEAQAEIIQDLFQMTSRLSRLNRNLLLLAKIDNEQFDNKTSIRLDTFMDKLLTSLETISGQLVLERRYSHEPLVIKANGALMESMVSNLIVNAVRHNRPEGKITIGIGNNALCVANTSDEPALPAEHIFNRFYRPAQDKGGNGLGLAIVKAICDYHGWVVEYGFDDGIHSFVVNFDKQGKS